MLLGIPGFVVAFYVRVAMSLVKSQALLKELYTGIGSSTVQMVGVARYQVFTFNLVMALHASGGILGL